MVHHNVYEAGMSWDDSDPEGYRSGVLDLSRAPGIQRPLGQHLRDTARAEPVPLPLPVRLRCSYSGQGLGTDRHGSCDQSA
jgi:hypothetical protein